MSWFGFGKKKCCCGSGCNAESMKRAETLKISAGIKILGSGCAKCNQLEQATKEALAELGIQAEIEHVTDFAQIAAYGVMTTPALVVGGKVVAYGKVLKKEEIIPLLQAAKSAR